VLLVLVVLAVLVVLVVGLVLVTPNVDQTNHLPQKDLVLGKVVAQIRFLTELFLSRSRAVGGCAFSSGFLPSII
jgi:sensor histidine kinase regulating citrate/malate metabolism